MQAVASPANCRIGERPLGTSRGGTGEPATIRDRAARAESNPVRIRLSMSTRMVWAANATTSSPNSSWNEYSAAATTVTTERRITCRSSFGVRLSKRRRTARRLARRPTRAIVSSGLGFYMNERSTQAAIRRAIVVAAHFGNARPRGPSAM